MFYYNLTKLNHNKMKKSVEKGVEKKGIPDEFKKVIFDFDFIL